MKKLILAGIVILIAAFFVTCDEPIVEDDAIVEYTDVVYSKDGSQVNIYLDGAKVPVTKAQRAMTRDLAMMSYDYLEVVFVTAGGTSRSAWELGQPAGISGTGLRISSSNYNNLAVTLAPTATLQYACLFAGSSSNKTLFGVGKISATTKKDGTAGGAAEINDDTQMVTFSLAALQTGLLIGAETPSGTWSTRGISAKSLAYADVTGGDVTAANNKFGLSGTAPNTFVYDNTAYGNLSATNSGRQTLPDGVAYPTYFLPKAANNLVNATYNFYFITGLTGTTPALTDVTDTYTPGIKHIGPTNPPVIQKRTPRFMDGGRYLEAKGHVDVKTQVYFTGTYLYTSSSNNLPAANAGFVKTVPIQFATRPGSGGIFSFYLEIPVYNLSNATAGINAGPASITWKIRTGLGPGLYNLDDGISSGGCVLMSVGASASDWLDIDWKWLD